MSEMPGCRVEVAWTTPPRTRPADADFTRIDEVTPLRRLKTKRGARIKVAELEAGEATFTHDNRTRALDPSNTASPWAPNVKPRRRIRAILEPVGEAARTLWTGFIERLPIGWEVGDGWAEVTAVDLLSLIAGDTLPPSVLHRTVIDTAPVAYWPLTETSGSTADDVIGTRDGVYLNGDAAAVDVVPYAAGGQGFSIWSTDDRLPRLMRAPMVCDTAEWALGFWYQADIQYPNDAAFESSVTTSEVWKATKADDSVILFRIINEPGTDRGRLYVIWYDNATAEYWESRSAAVNIIDGAPHFVFAQATGSQIDVYVDGVLGNSLTTTSGTPSPLGTATALIGNEIAALQSVHTSRWHAAHYAYWNRTLTAAEIADIYAAGVNPWDGDRTDERLERILDLAGIDAGDRDIAAGTAYCAPARLDGGNLVEYLRKIVATEPGGAMFVNADGQIAFRPAVANDPTPLATFVGDPDVDAGTPYADIAPDYSLDRVVNIAEVTRENEVTQRTKNVDSVDEFGPLGVQLATLHRTASGARGAGARLTNRYRAPRLVLRSVELNGRRDDVPPVDTLDRDIGDPVLAIARPTGGGDPIEQLARIESVDHDLDWQAHTWQIDYGLAEHVVLPLFEWDTVGQGWDESVWPAT